MPYSLKAQGDEQYCAGINRFVFHRYAHQPDNRRPGMTMGPWGINFERTNTWWEPGSLARAQWLEDRRSELLTTPYFHVVFTVPAEIAEIALHNKAVVYGILFRAAAESLNRPAAYAHSALARAPRAAGRLSTHRRPGARLLARSL